LIVSATLLSICTARSDDLLGAAVMAKAKYVHFNGSIVPWNEAHIHILSPVAKYGIGVFEGIRGYWNSHYREMFLFRVQDHMDRLAYSHKAMRFDGVVDGPKLTEGMVELIQVNEFEENIHIRVQLYIDGEGDVSARGPIGVAITAVPRPLPKQVVEGVTAQVSSWSRISDRSMPARVKCNANYHNGRLATLQAKADGYDAPILLNQAGKVSEGSSMCFFLVRGEQVITPSVTNDVLESITRDTVLRLAGELGYKPVERDIDRSELYAADEAFYCGTGWEITPIVGIDGLPVGAGRRGPIVCRLQKHYFDVVEGHAPSHAEWRMPVYRSVLANAPAR
jgi:branched-chain amino acid aminotransferase